MPGIWLKSALRHVVKHKTYSLLNIAGLAIGIACAGLIGLWVEDELNFDGFNAKKDRLYAVRVNWSYGDEMHTLWSTPRPMEPALKKEIPGVLNAARVSDMLERSLFSTGNTSLYGYGRYADSSIFSMLTLPFAEGDPGSAFTSLYSLVITESMAKKCFGRSVGVVGSRVRLDNQQDYVVTGVLKDLPYNSTLRFEWLAPYEITLKAHPSPATNWGVYGPFTYVELDGKANASSVGLQVDRLLRQKDPGKGTQAFLFPMKDWHLRDEFVDGKATGGGRIFFVHTLELIGWIILLMACINFMNLATARATQRAAEIGVRKVLGANRGLLILGFAGEALLMSLLAAVCSVLLIGLFLPGFNVLMQTHLTMHAADPMHILALATIALLTGLIAGIYPAIYLSRFNPVSVLKGWSSGSGGAAWLRKGLVVLQFSISMVFIVSTIVIYRQIEHVRQRDLGFNKDRLMEIDLQHDVNAHFVAIRESLMHSGVVESAALAEHSTLDAGNNSTSFNWPGKNPGQQVVISHRYVGPEYFQTTGMRIIAGKSFDPNRRIDSTNIIITRSLARLVGKGDVVGTYIHSGNIYGGRQDFRIAGVVEDYIYGNVYGTPDPVIFFCLPPQGSWLAYVRLRPVPGALNAVEAVIQKENKGYPFEYRFVDQQLHERLQAELQMSQISCIFAILAIVISCLGLFGLSVYLAAQRLREVGIRKVLGAQVTGLVMLLSGGLLRLVLLSCLIAFPIAGWIMQHWLIHFTYRITISWWIFGLAGAAALLIAALTVSFQTLRAAMSNPIKVLRNE